MAMVGLAVAPLPSVTVIWFDVPVIVLPAIAVVPFPASIPVIVPTPVPPFATGSIPLTSELARLIALELSTPVDEECTIPVDKGERVVVPELTVSPPAVMFTPPAVTVAPPLVTVSPVPAVSVPVALAFPGNTGFVVIDIVGFPAVPSPLAILIWSAVPVNVRAVKALVPLPTRMPVSVVAPVPPWETERVPLEISDAVNALKEGAPVPLELNTWPEVPIAEIPYAVPVPYTTPPAVGVAVEFVPPLAIGTVPDTSAVAKSMALVVEPLPIYWFAVNVPVPVAASVAPLPTIIDALVFVPLVIELNASVDAGVVHVGVPAPFEVSTWPDVPAAVKSYAVPVPYTTAPAVGVAVEFVPPLATGRVPLVIFPASRFGISSASSTLKVGAAFAPEAGPANTVFCD
jgi:hypothetical protein